VKRRVQQEQQSRRAERERLTEREESTYQGETWMLDSPEGVCAVQAGSEYPATSVLFSNFGPYGPA
jgi:hypothetical protein